jgi:hypothetical protein
MDIEQNRTDTYEPMELIEDDTIVFAVLGGPATIRECRTFRLPDGTPLSIVTEFAGDPGTSIRDAGKDVREAVAQRAEERGDTTFRYVVFLPDTDECEELFPSDDGTVETEPVDADALAQLLGAPLSSRLLPSAAGPQAAGESGEAPAEQSAQR